MGIIVYSISQGLYGRVLGFDILHTDTRAMISIGVKDHSFEL